MKKRMVREAPIRGRHLSENGKFNNTVAFPAAGKATSAAHEYS